MKSGLKPTRSTFLRTAGALALAAGPRHVGAQAAPIRIAGEGFSDQFQEPFFGRDAGIFAKAGLTVDVQSFNSSGAIIAALAGGAIDVGIGDLISAALAINAGVPITLFAGSGVFRASDPVLSALIVAKESSIRQPADINGKTIGVPSLVGIASVAMQAWLLQNGILQQSVKLFEIPSNAMPAALASGKVDAVFLGEPNLTLVRNDVRVIGSPYSAIGKEYLFAGWFASKSWLAEDKDRARKFVAAIYATARWANTHHDESFAFLAQNAKLQADKVKGMARVEYATYLTPALAQPSLNAAAQFKVFKEPVDASSIITRV